MPVLMQVSTMEPQVTQMCGFPHIAKFTFPRAGVFGGVGAQKPTFAHLVCDIFKDEFSRPAIHRAITHRIEDHVGFQLAAIRNHN